jgi:hypothetical protein
MTSESIFSAASTRLEMRGVNTWLFQRLTWCLLLCLGVWFGVQAKPAAAVPIRVTYTDSGGEGFNDPTLGAARRTAFEAAASKWGTLLSGSVPVEIQASFDPLGGTARLATLGSAGPTNFLSDFTGATLSDTYYPAAIANQLAGRDTTPDEAEIRARFNSDVDNSIVLGDTDFYYGLDGQPGSDTDFYAVALHEIGHGMGMVAFIEEDGGFNSDAISIYDRFLALGSNADAPRVVDLSQSARADAVISDNLFFAGPNARAANGGTNAKLYAPDADYPDPIDPNNPGYDPGSSVSHLDEIRYTGINELMTPEADGAPRDPGPVATGLYRDLGWGFGPSPQPSPSPSPTVTSTPIPNVPLNDNFEAAQALTGNVGQVTGTNVGATAQFGEQAITGSPAVHSVWYQWTAPSAGQATFTTEGSTFDTVLAVYTGTAVNALTKIAQNDDITVDQNRQSRVIFTTVAGQKYFIAVDSFNSTQGAVTGSIKLSWTFAPSTPIGPANNNFAAAQVLSGTSGRVTGTNVGATKETGEPTVAGNPGGKSVWYKWTATTTGTATFATAGSSFDTVLGAFTGTAVNALTLVAQNDDIASSDSSSRITFNAVAGRTYFIVIDGFQGASGNIVLTWTSTGNPTGSAPTNNPFATPRVIAGSTGRTTATNVGATKETGEPIVAGNAGGKSIWFSWRAPATGRWTFGTQGSSFDTLLGVYTGTAVNALRLVGSNDNVFGTTTSAVSFNATAGTTYRIVVDGRNGASGPVLLTWGPTPANDLFTNARELTGNAGKIVDTNNSGATRDTGEPAHAGNTSLGSHSMWYKWTAPAAGRATFFTAGSTFDTVLAVYTGTSVGALRVVAANDNVTGTITSSATFNTTAGTTYMIAVDGKNNTVGIPVLQWSLFIPPPPNDNFAQAEVLAGTVGTRFGTNLNSSREVGEPVHGGSGGAKSVWYKWTAPSVGRFFVSTSGSNLNTVVAIYTGTSPGALTPIAANDDVSATDKTSFVSANVVAGTTYFVAIDGFNNNGSVATGNFKLNYVFKAGAALVQQRSTVALSTAMASAASERAQLTFSRVLDAVSASEVANYTVSINGVVVEVEGVALSNGNRMVSLWLPEGALQSGDRVEVIYQLRDSSGLSLNGSSGTLVAK